MPIESAADRLDLVTTFGEAAVFVLADASNWDVFGIFDNEFVDVNGIESTHPIIRCRYDDTYYPGELQTMAKRVVAVQVSAGGYNVIEVQSDGTGMTLLVLEKQ